ncbi:hypothetical protein B0H13DRAFT_2003844 [Mycena leptocephala]|nr:hypothetical protein B0H13DRAFT_2003844 [Mycena leptocephala]
MAPLHHYLALFSTLGVISAHTASELQDRKVDPCAVIGGKKWVAPSDVRACLSSFKVDPAIKSNILDVVSKTLAFHTSVTYEIKAPEPFSQSVHEDLFKDIARISKTQYASDYDLHIDLSRTLKRLNDGHCVWINACYVHHSLFLNFLPIPLTLLTEKDGSQNVHIVPEAFQVASAEFADEISVWQAALPGPLKGKLESLSGAKVLLINGKPPFDAVDANALITGSFQALGTRQNSFFSSYAMSGTSWAYGMGNFAQQSLPLSDSVDLVIQRVNSTKPEQITLPYRSRINPATVPFNNSATYRANNCLAVDGTNGVDLHAAALAPSPAGKFQQAPISPSSKKQKVNVILDTAPLSDVVLPPTLQPTAPALNGSFGSGTFYMQKDGITGVLALGSFGGDDFDVMENGLLEGLLTLKDMGATRLVVDVTNNGGGFICVAHWLHRIIVGPKSTTVPQAGLDTKARDGPLARQIVQQIITKNLDPNQELLYNPLNWNDANNVQFAATDDWLLPPVNLTINGHADAFSQRLGQECQPGGFVTTPPDVALFDPSKVVIISNGVLARARFSASLWPKKKASRPSWWEAGKAWSRDTAALSGVRRRLIQPHRDRIPLTLACDLLGQSTDFSTIDTEIKTTQLKNSSLAPPDLLVNGVQGITWRLGFGIVDTQQPEEWQDHPADLNLPLTPDLVNNPVAIWEAVTAKLLV